jgi:hypothetical protein
LALYFFHLANGHDALIDPEGQEVAHSTQIPALALYEARSVMSHDVLVGRIHLDQYIEVRDTGGKLIHQLAFRDAVKIRDHR